MKTVTSRRPELAVFAAALALAALARLPAGTWTIDDAAITYSYARNIAAGHGAVAFAGGMPTEGYSNPLTLFVSVVLEWLGLLHPLTSHLFLEIPLFAFACALVCAWLRRLGVEARAAAGGGVLFALVQLAIPACRVWYFSGLENVQLTVAVVLLLVRLEVWWRDGPTPWLDGPVLFLICLVRPEAPLYPLAAAIVFVSASIATAGARRRSRAWLGRGAATALLAAALVLLALAARWLYFGALLPNTYYAKAHGTFSQTARPDYWEHLSGYVAGDLASYQYSILLLGLGLVVGRKPAIAVLGVTGLLVASLGLPVLAGADWMGEHRFGTTTITLCHLMLVLGLATASDRAARGRDGIARIELAGTALAAGALLILVAASGIRRYDAFMSRPHATFENVFDSGGLVRMDLQRRLALAYPTVYQPDSGGTHYLGREQSVDGLRLTDFHLARVWGRGREERQYVYSERTPELVEGHHWFPMTARFGRDYFTLRVVDNPASDLESERIPYYARRDLVEVVGEPPAGNLLVRNEDYELWLSPRTVAVAAPRATVRIELLVRPVRGLDTQLLAALQPVEVCVESDCDALKPFTFHPDQPAQVIPALGRIYRHGFLVRAPAAEGRYPVRITVPGAPAAAAEPGEDAAIGDLLVTRDPAGSKAGRRLRREGLPVAERAFLLSRLDDQSRPRMSRAELEATTEAFRRASRDGRWSALAFFDRLMADFDAAPVPEARPALAEWRRELEREAAAEIAARLGRPVGAGAGERALAAAGLAFNLRRLGLKGATRLPEVRAAARSLTAGLEETTRLRRSYQLAVAVTVIRPGAVTVQKRLLALRRELLAEAGGEAFEPLLYAPM